MADQRLPLALFDLDDTLCDYESARNERLAIAFSQADDLDSKRVDDMVAESIAHHHHGTDHFPALFARYGINDPSAADSAAAWYRTNRFHGLKLFADTEPVLRSIRHAGYPVGIITNGPADVQRAKVNLLGVNDLVDFAIVSGEFGVAKPHPSIFHAALKAGGRSASEALFVGDALEFDITGANGVAIRSVWMNRRGKTRNAADPKPNHEVSDLHQVFAILREVASE
ncbi:MAG: HAD family hydrolase [Thermomicrobiales bacterium]